MKPEEFRMSGLLYQTNNVARRWTVKWQMEMVGKKIKDLHFSWREEVAVLLMF